MLSHQPSFRRAKSLRGNLRNSSLDAAAYGFTVGAGEAYITAFALAIGLGEVVSGITSSVPMLCGGVLQLLSLYALPRFGSYKRWIVTGVALQSAIFIPLIAAALYGKMPVWAFFATISCYWGFGLASAPAWNAWISHIVPNSIRADYFARRTRVIQVTTLIGFLGGGCWLAFMEEANLLLIGYAILFFLAFGSRIASAYFLKHHATSRAEDYAAPRTTGVLDTWISVSPKARLLILYLVGMTAFIQFSGPYFIPFMMKQIGYGYNAFVTVLASAFIARALSMNLWGMVARRFGSERLLWVGGLGLLPLSTLWTISDAWPWLVFVQVLSGFLWSAYELGFFLMFLDYIPQRRRADMLSIYYFANSIAHCTGALAGGWWIAAHGTTIAAYHGVFVISALGRAACLGLLWRMTTSSALPTKPDPKFDQAHQWDQKKIDSPTDTGAAPLQSPIIDSHREAA